MAMEMELLKKLLADEILTEETKKELEEAIAKQISEASEAASKEAAEATRVQITEQWVAERDALVEAIDTKVNEYLAEEMKQLVADIEKFRDLEAEKAAELVEAKAEMTEQVKKDIAQLINELDSFLETRIAEEFSELKENIEEVRKLEFGKEVFEAFGALYQKRFVDEDSVEAQLRESQEREQASQKLIQEATEKAAKLERQIKLEAILKPLVGKQRDVMETLLTPLATDKLNEGYKTFIGRVVKETVTEGKDENSEQETKVLAEDKSAVDLTEGTAVVKTGNNTKQLAEDKLTDDADKSSTVVLAESEKKRLRQLAGIE